MTISKELAAKVVFEVCQMSDAYLRKVDSNLRVWEYPDTNNWPDFKDVLDTVKEEQLEGLLSII